MLNLNIGPVRCFQCGHCFRVGRIYESLAKNIGEEAYKAYKDQLKITSNDYEKALELALSQSEYKSIDSALQGPNVYANMMTELFQVVDIKCGVFRTCCAQNVMPYLTEVFIREYDRESATDIRGPNPSSSQTLSSSDTNRVSSKDNARPQNRRILSSSGLPVKKMIPPTEITTSDVETSFNKLSITQQQTLPITPLIKSGRLSPRSSAVRT
jgi:DNA-directed RNA polymerase subunit N (RpoN/RPB10)